MGALQDSVASEQQRDDLELTLAVYVALLVGVAVTATLHSLVGPTSQFGQSGALQWTSTYSVNNVAPLVAAALGFVAGRQGGLEAVGRGFVGNAVGYLVFFLGTYAVNAVVFEVAQSTLSLALLAANAAGIGVTAALFAVVAARYT